MLSMADVLPSCDMEEPTWRCPTLTIEGKEALGWPMSSCHNHAPVVGVVQVSEYVLLLSLSQLLSCVWTAERIPSQWGMLDAFGHLTAVDSEYVDSATIKYGSSHPCEDI